ncbi:MAG: UvrD-helicase domain-containing protein [Clostridia bacterium]|nr:UvrD-helicase domain-containing protein [Clostridia bacterium]
MPAYKQEQLDAINAQGKTIVSASAGSGKTTVMIEKIVRLILSGTPVENILAVTYTKKAAAQMKEKLRDKLIEKINEKGADASRRAYLKAQLSGVNTADICTIHSFCSKLLKQNFFDGGVSNTFSVISATDAEGKTLMSEALDGIFGEGYRVGDEDFYHLLSLYFKKKKDAALREILFTSYESLRSRDDYRQYLLDSGTDSKERFDEIGRGLTEDLHARCQYYREALEKEEGFFNNQPKCEQSKKQINAVIDYLCELLAERDYFACAQKSAKFPSSQSIKEGQTPTDVAHHILRTKELVVGVKDLQKQLRLTDSYEEEYEKFKDSMRTARALAKYLLLLDDSYSQLKREKDLLDYSDLEHFALRLLERAEMQAEMRKKYTHVFVDEYQDVNPVQEKLLSYVAGDNLFLVGDVKQSIYGFRGSKSQFFVEKEKAYRAAGHNALVLPQNFRSAPAILEAVNTQFSAMMTKENTSVDYAGEGKMQTGGLYVADDGSEAYGRVRVHFCEKALTEEKASPSGVYSVKSGKKKGAKGYSAQVQKVLQIITQEKKYGQWYDVKSSRYQKVDYGDIAVLYRNASGEVADLSAALSAADIPVVGGDSLNVCDYPEIKTMIDLLSLIDNERQDIPLCSALVSLQEISNQQLSQIRLAYQGVSFYEACRCYAAQKEDALADVLTAFFEKLASLRILSQVQSAGEIITRLLTRTSLEIRFLSKVGGEEAMQRVHRFLEEASNPEPMTVQEFLDRLKALDYKIICPVSGGENAVKLMTMHASKGLEFPVVILFDLGKKLHDVDDAEVLVDDRYGLAPMYRNVQERVYRPTLLRRLHVNVAGREQIKDELNVYYVAATRAMYAMHLLYKERSLLANPRFGNSFQSFTDFSLWEKFVYADEPFEVPYQQRTAIPVQEEESLVRALERTLTEEYAFAGLENHPVKDSATGLMKGKEDPFGVKTAPQESYFAMDEEEGVDKQTRGLAYHAFLEHFDFASLSQGDLRQTVKASLARMRAERAFDEGYFAYLEEGKLCEILSLPIFTRLSGCRLYKERAFLVGLPIETVYRLKGEQTSAADKDAEVLFQGAIDLLAVGEDKTYVVDYKFSSGGERYLKEKYAPQLALYKEAVAKITGRPKERVEGVIVNISKGFEVEM